jgi:putative membrane protein
MKISMSKTREQFPLSKKKIIKKTISSGLSLIFVVIIALVMGVISIFGMDISTRAFLIAAAIGLVILVIIILFVIYFYQKWYFAVYFYDLTEDFIIIRKGPITPHEITIPYERVQDVYVDQDLLDRIMGLYDVHLSSATSSSGAAAHIDGVEKEAADGLRNVLLKTVQQKMNRNRQTAVTNN